MMERGVRETGKKLVDWLGAAVRDGRNWEAGTY
jgi:hypothetical protein